METIRNIIIHAQEVKKGKQTFIACSAQIGGRWYKVKFTKDVVDNPKEKGLYDLTIDFDTCSLEKGHTYVRKDGSLGSANDIIWVKNIVALRQHSEEELRDANRAAFAGVFEDED